MYYIAIGNTKGAFAPFLYLCIDVLKNVSSGALCAIWKLNPRRDTLIASGRVEDVLIDIGYIDIDKIDV